MCGAIIPTKAIIPTNEITVEVISVIKIPDTSLSCLTLIPNEIATFLLYILNYMHIFQ